MFIVRFAQIYEPFCYLAPVTHDGWWGLRTHIEEAAIYRTKEAAVSAMTKAIPQIENNRHVRCSWERWEIVPLNVVSDHINDGVILALDKAASDEVRKRFLNKEN